MEKCDSFLISAQNILNDFSDAYSKYFTIKRCNDEIIKTISQTKIEYYLHHVFKFQNNYQSIM